MKFFKSLYKLKILFKNIYRKYKKYRYNILKYKYNKIYKEDKILFIIINLPL